MKTNIKLNEKAENILENILDQNPREIKNGIVNLLTAISAFIEDTTNIDLYFLKLIYELYDEIEEYQNKEMEGQLEYISIEYDSIRKIVEEKDKYILKLIENNSEKDLKIKELTEKQIPKAKNKK